MGAMSAFLADYEPGKAEGRYVAAALPGMPFADLSFDLALVSHLLFLYSEHLDEAAHVAGALELLRVAREVRLFPLLTLEGERSPFVDVVGKAARGVGCYAEETPVPYEFQRRARAMLRLWRA